ncbi:hypothetical protein THRCLA_20813 [Thraustotheca clavata]|uniref:Uncharacterized protein n=1 Tax=Thraustotheca clavata TaxID=74557 RepID=A0A1W0A358_9STRA|nr:hypothetical protein THRCLA_20813 [Thraustotheca clavata]
MVALDVKEALLQMEYRAWCGEVRHTLSRLMSLGSVMIPRKAPRTEPYSLIRLDKCPLLWQVKGGDDAFIQRKGDSDVVLFPQMFARFEDSVTQLSSLDGITFVQLDLTNRLHMHPTSTLRELDALQITADKLKASREKLLEKLQNAGFEEFLSKIRADVSSKCHKLALIYVHTQLRSVSTANRQKAHHIVSRRRYDFSKWIEVKAQVQNEAIAAEEERLQLLAAIPPPPPNSIESNKVVIVLNWEGEKFLDAIKTTHRSLTHGRAYEFAGKLQDQFGLSVANYTSFQRSKSVQAVSDDLKHKEIFELEVLTQSNAIESYITSLLPKQQRIPAPPPVNNKAPVKRVTFPPAFLHVKYFDKNCPPLDIATTEVVMERVPDIGNTSLRGGPTNTPRRNSLPAYDPVTRSKVARYS